MDEVYGFDRETAERLKAIAGQPRKLHSQQPYRRRQPSGGGELAYAWPPTGGIPGAQNSSTELTPGIATCELAKFVDGTYERSGETVSVENPVSYAVGVGGRALTIGKTSYGKWTVLVEDCGAVDGGGGGPSPEPPTDPYDSVETGGSRSVDMHYVMGV